MPILSMRPAHVPLIQSSGVPATERAVQRGSADRDDYLSDRRDRSRSKRWKQGFEAAVRAAGCWPEGWSFDWEKWLRGEGR